MYVVWYICIILHMLARTARVEPNTIRPLACTTRRPLVALLNFLHRTASQPASQAAASGQLCTTTAAAAAAQRS